MRVIFLFFILFHQSLLGTYLFPIDEANISSETKTNLFNLIIKAEPPRSFYNNDSIDLVQECAKIISNKPIWITPALWQLACVHLFFFDQEFRNAILSFKQQPLEFDELTKNSINSRYSLREISEQFDRMLCGNKQLEWIFFRANQAVYDIYKRASSSEIAMLSLILSELPPLHKWPDFHFPFWDMPYINNPNSINFFYQSLMDEKFLRRIIEIEQHAHQNGEWVLYRGFEGDGWPTTLEYEQCVNHALSFGSTLLGGVFFSIEATALTYCVPNASEDYTFLALSATPEDFRNLFQVGPIHPLIQLLSDGEMFHAHTKVAAETPFDYLIKPINGYFMKCNQHLVDHSGYVLTFHYKAQEFEDAFLSLCKRRCIKILRRSGA